MRTIDNATPEIIIVTVDGLYLFIDCVTFVACTEDIDECLASPCGPGTCVNGQGNYTCNCDNTGRFLGSKANISLFTS